MKTQSTILFLLLLTSLTSQGQRQADLNKFVKISDNAGGAIDEIDTLTQILTTKFLKVANDIKTKTHKDIQDFFWTYKLGSENKEINFYPKTLKKEHLTIQYIDYSTNHGFVGQAADSAFNQSELTALILIPAFDIFHKGEGVSTICFKATLRVYTESAINSDNDYKREEKLTELKMIKL